MAKRSSGAGILLSYFEKAEEAEKAKRKLKLLGFHRIATLCKASHRRNGPLVEARILKAYGRWLLTGETALVVQAPVDSLNAAVKALRESGDIPPAIFIFHEAASSPSPAPRNGGVPLSPLQVGEQAQRLATEHRIDVKHRKGRQIMIRLDAAYRLVRDTCVELSQAGRLELGTTATAEWILDNEYVVESNARDVVVNLPRKFYKRLPSLASGRSSGLPRIYDLADELISDLELRLDRKNILAFLDAYQSASVLTIAELWAIPQMLRIALIERIGELALRASSELRERESADFWANRLIRASRRGPDQLFAILAEIAVEFPVPSSYFSAQLVDHLYNEESVLLLVQAWLKRMHHQSLSELSLREQNRQAKDQISVGNAFTSLRQLALLDWREIFESQSRVERLLLDEECGVYPEMDFQTRDSYRRAIEGMSYASARSEEAVARAALELTAETARDSSCSDERRRHVGTYLVGEGRPELVELLDCAESRRYRFLHWVYRRSSALFFFSLGILTLGSTLLVALAGAGGPALDFPILLALLLVLPLSQLVLEALNYLATRMLPPRVLPKMDFEEAGIPESCRTLVVVPILLGDAQSIRNEVEKLEVRYLANRGDNLLFSLFTDYRDAGEEHLEEDASLLRAAVEGIESLNRLYGDGRFFLFHRERAWCETERKFIGWERKRGKLEELNGLLSGRRPAGSPKLVYVGNEANLAGPNGNGVRFVITLDSDTQLPLGAARRMIETLAHPLNQARFDEEGRVLPGGYTIIQPRVSPSLPSSSASLFSRLFADAVGIDPYTRAISDVHQDLKGEGSYYGKGIYDLRAFDRVLGGRFPEARLLSHDLIEGSYVRVGLASDIELYDEFPRSYASYADRQHRWIRGDWQIAQWITPRVPRREGGTEKNPLSAYDRWKLFDNLRRSLVSAADLVLLVGAWAISPRTLWVATLVVLVQLFFRPLMQPFTMLTSRRGLKGFSPVLIAHDLVRALTDAALLPHQAILAVDAILRTLYRRHFSHRKMLQWNSTQELPLIAPPTAVSRKMPLLSLTTALVGAASAAAAIALALRMPSSLANCGPWLALWLTSPAVAWLLNRPKREPRRRAPLLPSDSRFLREIARLTWRYFDDFVNAYSSWLPPDNYQVSPRNELALRTSPTNIGLWMLSALGAGEFGYLTTDQVVERLSNSFRTIAVLERYDGHLLNWYDLRTRTALEPRYVSMVDSGNLLASLWTLEQGLVELYARPLLDACAFAGLQDAGRILRRVLGRGVVPNDRYRALVRLTKDWESPPTRFVDMLALLREGALRIGCLGGPERQSEDTGTEEGYWTLQIGKQLSAWLSIADRYLSWMEILGEMPEEKIPPSAAQAVRLCLAGMPSLIDIAGGRVDCIAILKEEGEGGQALDPSTRDWLDRLLEAFSKSRWLAGEVLGKGRELIGNCRDFSAQVDMGFLYDPERRLFSIGYDVSEGRRDESFYDLLASEARLGSFIAIARGEVPFEHWFSLSRPYAAVGRKRVLLSWTGTMFEYLMPLLFQDSMSNTLLGEASRGALATQIAYGRRHRVPWGISESAFADMDLNKIYQYRAFGVPALRLKRESEDKVVVAPYATLLALEMAPREVLRNLRRLAAYRLLDARGYYEAIDFSREPGRTGERGVVVQSYMAHHQGMSFLSLANFLLGGPIRRNFYADARVRSVEALLHERIPRMPASHYVSARERPLSTMSVDALAPATSGFDTAHTRTPKTQLLSNGRYSLMVTNAGGGYSQWGAQEITRWSSDPTRDSWGTFFYIHESDSDVVWTPTYHPVGGKDDTQSVSFALDRAVFQRLTDGIHSRMEIVLSPEDDVEIRRITLTNRSLRNRRLDCTSYIELSMAPHAADRQHPAFNKLFIRTEALPAQHALLASRRLREGEASPIYVAHRLTPETGAEGTMRFETDRRRFIGRGRSLANPLGAIEEPRGGEGFVLDPILSIRTTFILAPGQRATVSLVVAVGETREQALGLMGKYADPHAIARALDFAWAAAQLELRVLRIQNDDARRFQQLAGQLLYPSRLLRSHEEKIKENKRGQAGLWQYGISGDLPIALVGISDLRDIGLVGQMLQAHGYWRMHGLKVDLVILAEESSGYERPLHERLEALIQARSTNTGRDRPGGVFLRSSDQIPEADLTLLQAAASIFFASARGSLARQMGFQEELPDKPERHIWKNASKEPSAPLPFLQLPYFNGLGGFTSDGREYAIYLGAGANTPSPWVNVIANPSFGCLVTERGSGFAWSGNSQRNRLTAWSNDPVVDPCSEVLFLRDEETGLVWTPTAAPIRDENAYRVRHGAGYSVFEHNSNGIEQELTVFVPMDEGGGKPVKLQLLKLKNASSRTRTLSLTYYVEWVLGEQAETSRMQVVTAWDEEMGAVTARNSFNPDYPEHVSFAAIGPIVDSYSGDRGFFIGRNRSLESAAAMERSALSGRTGAGYDPCAALRMLVQLAPGETRVIVCMLGQTESLEAARDLVSALKDERAAAACLASTKAWWDRFLGTVEVHTPELAADFLVNRWLLYQTLSCRVWGRSAFYQSGGAFGFRDQLQDVMALFYAAPDLARDHILLAASRQFREGDVQHWWHPPGGAGIRSRITDDLLWLPFVLAQYVRITGDVGILKAEVPFLDGPTLREDQHEAFFTPTVSQETAGMFEHCRRAVARGFTAGPHGLPLMGRGDWNDGMNLVGANGKGESVWLAWFLVDVLRGMSEMSDALGMAESSAEYLKQREALIARIEAAAWDGEWYIRAINDEGAALGSAANAEARIDSLPQSWATLSGGDSPRSKAALESAWKELVREKDGLVLLFTPPFDKAQPSPGYVQAYPPGVRENGGQYTHAAVWLAMAMARSGDGTRAGRLLHVLNPIEQARSGEAAGRYSVEPYVATADVYDLQGSVGRGGWSWYTGSAAWMYRAWVEEALGLKIRGDRLTLDPVIPGWWSDFSMKYRHGEAVYEIRVENPENVERGVAWVEMDGKRLEGGIVALDRASGAHSVLARMGASRL